MREIRPSGSEGGGDREVSPYPYLASERRHPAGWRVAISGHATRVATVRGRLVPNRKCPDSSAAPGAAGFCVESPAWRLS